MQHQLFQDLGGHSRFIKNKFNYTPPEIIKPLKFKVSLFRIIRHFFKWFLAGGYYCSCLFFDRLRKNVHPTQKAFRLRKTFEFMGGTMVKIGQQMSIRVDMLPYEYCIELSKMLDNMPIIPIEQTIEQIEKSLNKKMDQVFQSFDPNPIGSASIACVYKAKLLDNSTVAVKVRRPGIGQAYRADLIALDWICVILEFFTILNPGITQTFRQGLKNTLLEEIDFRSEARYQRLFRNRFKKKQIEFIHAPSVHTQLSSEDLIVMEFIDGIFMTDILSIVETQDKEGLQLLKEKNINPNKIASRLLYVSHSAMISEPFFHSDPHPANVLVKENNQLVFIDFGSCGFFTQSQRLALKQINHYQYLLDPEGMAKCTINLLEPLPNIDVEAFTRELEHIYRLSIYAMEDEDALWWERTTAAHWFSFAKVALKFNVPLPLNLLHMIRATMLYDTISVRLDKDINYYEQFRKNERLAGMIARKKIRSNVKDMLLNGLDPKHYLKFEQFYELANQSVFYMRKLLLNRSEHNYRKLVTTGSFIFSLVLIFSSIFTLITGIMIIYLIHLDSIQGYHQNLLDYFKVLLSKIEYLSFLGLMILFFSYRIILHFVRK